MKLDVLNESRNSIAMLRARLAGDFGLEREQMNLVEDAYKYIIAQNALLCTLCQIIDNDSGLLNQLNNNASYSLNANDVLDLLAKKLASHNKLEVDVDDYV